VRAGEIQAWDQNHDARPIISAYPADTPDSAVPAGLVIDKADSRLVVSST
jgi:protein-L-isoaspartate(D-aspartate) O-methyltransferase